jgi:hypothetical protein
MLLLLIQSQLMLLVFGSIRTGPQFFGAAAVFGVVCGEDDDDDE